jgi:hypothetical protein
MSVWKCKILGEAHSQQGERDSGGWTMRLIATFFATLVTLSAFARIVPNKDPLDGVLDAELVVIAGPSLSGKPGIFRIDEAFLGELHAGDSIDLGDFKLSVIQRYGPPKIEPITPATRILFFLQRAKNSATLWKPTYFEESYFWVQRTEDVALLKRAAERAVNLRREWEKAAATPDLRLRVAELWPFLSLPTYGVSFLQHTQFELQKAAPVAGEYFADHLDGMSHNDRMSLLPEAGVLGSNRLHDKLRKHLDLQRHIYEEYIAALGRLPSERDWTTMPESANNATGETYYGLTGLARFQDRNDLPFIRATAVWAAKYHLEQTAEAAVDAFRDMPDRANLPTFEIVLKEFLPERKPGMASIDFDAERALCQHKYPETIPLLAPFTADAIDPLAGEAEHCLAEIVGRDLGRSPGAWIDWYTSASRSTQTTTPN